MSSRQTLADAVSELYPNFILFPGQRIKLLWETLGKQVVLRPFTMA